MTITYDGDVDERVGGSISLENVAQVGAEAATYSDAAWDTYVRTDITTITDGAWIVDIASHGSSGTLSTDQPGMLERWDRNNGTITAAGSTTAVATAGVKTVEWDFDDSEDNNTMCTSIAAFALWAPTMHIEAVACSQIACGKKHSGEVTVTINDHSGDPVQSALVDGTFSGDFSETINDVSTDANGEAVFITSGNCKKNPEYAFEVDDVTHATLTYNSSEDVTSGCSQ